MSKVFKLISLIIFIALISVQLVFADEAIQVKFSDLEESYWAFGSIQNMIDAGIVSGYPDNTFRPDSYISRAELVKIANLVFSYTQKQETTNLSDVKSDDWFYEHVLIAQEAGYIVGYEDGTFRPGSFVTRQELCKILDSINNFAELPSDKYPADEVAAWAAEYVNRVISNRIMSLDENNNFRAAEYATRAEVCDAFAKFVLKDSEIQDTPDVQVPEDNEEELTKEQLYDTIDRVIVELSTDVISNLNSDNQKEIVNDIIYNMNAYKADNSHDYENAAEAAYEKYKQLSEEERKELKYEIQIRNSTKDLLILQEFFFPDADIQ